MPVDTVDSLALINFDIKLLIIFNALLITCQQVSLLLHTINQILTNVIKLC